MPLRVVSIIGTRPDALKMAPVIQQINRLPDQVEHHLISTGQHQEMLRQVLDVFHLRPDHELQIMSPGQSLAGITSRILDRLDPLLEKISPQVLIAQGDTTTTFAGSLAAFYRRIPVAHVEAGLRTNNRYDPFPEEMNRRLTGSLASLHFAPTSQAAENLRREGVSADSIHEVGNTVIDALLQAAEVPFEFEDAELRRVVSSDTPLLLVTAHRRENLGAPLRRICSAVRRLAEERANLQIVFQMHRNPAVRQVICEVLQGRPRVLLIDPQEYLPWTNLMKRSSLILTDSGGIQEEAPALGKPVLVMRETTERPEGIAAGTACLVGTDVERIAGAVTRLLDSGAEYERMARAVNPYGDGRASEKIVSILLSNLQAAGN